MVKKLGGGGQVPLGPAYENANRLLKGRQKVLNGFESKLIILEKDIQ